MATGIHFSAVVHAADLSVVLVGVFPCLVYCEEIRVFKAGSCLDTSAWNNKIGLRLQLGWCLNRNNGG